MSDKPLVPKRGAFPTPKDVRDKAPPYIPHDAADDPQDNATNPPDRTRPQDDQSNAKDRNTKQK